MLDKLKESEIKEIDSIDIDDKDHFMIDSKDKLGWALRKIKVLQEEMEDVNYTAKMEMDRINDWKINEMNLITNKIDFFKSLIEIYAIKKREENEKFKTESTPYGKVRFKKQQAQWEFDNEVLTTYLLETNNSELIKTVYEPKKSEVKKRFVVDGNNAIDKETGEIVRGIFIKDMGEKIEIIPDK